MASKARIAIGCIFILIGIAGVVLAAVFLRETTTVELHGRFGIVFDAGGSGTRMTVYEYKNGSAMTQVAYIKCEREGIQHYDGRENEMIEKFQKCLEDAEAVVPADAQKLTPLYFEATAGMRALKIRDQNAFDKVWDTINPVLRGAPFKLKEAGILPGLKEAAYSWAHINDLVEGSKMIGLTETGSTSLQIAFVPKQESDLRSSTSTTVKVGGKDYTIYAHSYLCGGVEATERRLTAKLIDAAGYAENITDPCQFKGFQKTVTEGDIWYEPCVKGEFARNSLGASYENKGNRSFYRIIGGGDYDQCAASIEDLFKKKTCTHTDCGLLGVYQPLPHDVFIGLGNAYYASSFMNLTSNFTGSEFEVKTKKLCNTPLSQIQTMKGYDKYSSQRCLGNTFTTFLMKEALKFDFSKKMMTFKGKVNGANVGWTYGLIATHLDDLSPPSVKSSEGVKKGHFAAVLVCSCLVILVGLLLCATARKYHKSPKTGKQTKVIINAHA